jgi:hypothetical protein
MCNHMNRGKVHIKHPLMPDRRVIVTLLLLIQVPDGEVVGNVEQGPFIPF